MFPLYTSPVPDIKNADNYARPTSDRNVAMLGRQWPATP